MEVLLVVVRNLSRHPRTQTSDPEVVDMNGINHSSLETLEVKNMNRCTYITHNIISPKRYKRDVLTTSLLYIIT